MNEPLSPPDAKALIIVLLRDGEVTFSGHAKKEMAKDRLTFGDVLSVLRAGVVEPGEFEHGGWRYRVRTSRMYVVIAFCPPLELAVVTAWRVKK